ncbi:unnamed protein product [Polarella glacialis]|uniref:RING-CH-type domain-containing protein n=1 Tax=Polarella glacialis TaxID=89957 RepID=A0A813IVG3_POLGL|nr:unnamed protein product [Polarella glacialis]
MASLLESVDEVTESGDEHEVSEHDKEVQEEGEPELLGEPPVCSNGEAQCRICHSSAELAELLAPCICSGSIRYVHSDCLEAWRRTNRKNAVSCSICNARYSHICVPDHRLVVCLYLKELLMRLSRITRLVFMPSSWSTGGAVEQAVWSTLRSPCLLAVQLRLWIWALALLAASIVGSLLLRAVLAAHEFVVGFEHATDQLLLPDSLLRALQKLFPAIGGFGYLGVYGTAENLGNALREYVEAEKEWDVFLEDIGSLGRRAAEAVLEAELLQSAVVLPRSHAELFLGVLLLLLAWSSISANQGWAHRFQEVPGPVEDILNLLQELVGRVDSYPAFILVDLPMEVYFVRWMLSYRNWLPMDAFPLQESIDVNIILALMAASVRLALYKVITAISEDCNHWYAQMTFADRAE